jgi:hypothetical protein
LYFVGIIIIIQPSQGMKNKKKKGLLMPKHEKLNKRKKVEWPNKMAHVPSKRRKQDQVN